MVFYDEGPSGLRHLDRDHNLIHSRNPSISGSEHVRCPVSLLLTSGPRCPLELQFHSFPCLYSPNQVPASFICSLSLSPIFLLVLTVLFHWPRNPSTTQRYSLGGCFCVISPLMSPLSAASDMDYKSALWVYIGMLMPRNEAEFSL